MESFEGKIAVVTGGGSGMGRELVIQLAADGCSVATCDVNLDSLEETTRLAEKDAPASTRITTHQCDVSDEAQVLKFRDEVLGQHETAHVNLLFNNAGIGGGGSFISADRAEWERTFGICWGGVYNCSRAFVPLLIASDDGYLVNTSSVNGFWASLGPGRPHTAYSAAKFAVKGFSEALLEDFRVNAPHVKVAVVMPGHIGTNIVGNSLRVLSNAADDDSMRRLAEMVAAGFRDSAPTSAAEAARIILDGVRNDRWRILVGDDAEKLDEVIRANPEGAYGADGVRLPTLGALGGPQS